MKQPKRRRCWGSHKGVPYCRRCGAKTGYHKCEHCGQVGLEARYPFCSRCGKKRKDEE